MYSLFSSRKSGKARKAQINQAFVYIAAILVIGVIAVVGAKAMFSLLKSNCDTKNNDMVTDISRFIDEYSDKGSVHIETIPSPCEARLVCFVSYAKLQEKAIINAKIFDPEFPDKKDGDAVISDSVKDGAYNIFLVGEFTTPIGKAEKLVVNAPVDTDVVCLKDTTGYFKIRFTGQGRSTLVEEG
jgi:hypothetical protein